jgi:hypothetical protein
MTTRKARIYLVQLGSETKLVRANGAGQAINTVAKDFIRARVAESEDLIRIANQAGANLSIASPPERDPNAPKRGPGRPPRSDYTDPDSVVDPAFEAAA